MRPRAWPRHPPQHVRLPSPIRMRLCGVITNWPRKSAPRKPGMPSSRSTAPASMPTSPAGSAANSIPAAAWPCARLRRRRAIATGRAAQIERHGGGHPPPPAPASAPPKPSVTASSTVDPTAQAPPAAAEPSKMVLSSLEPAAQPETPAKPARTCRRRREMVHAELARLGCYPGAVDGSWGSSSRRALEQFNKHAGQNLDTKVCKSRHAWCAARQDDARLPAAMQDRLPRRERRLRQDRVPGRLRRRR